MAQALISFRNLTGFHLPNINHIILAIYGGVACPAVSLFIITFFITHKEGEAAIDGIGNSIEEAGFLIRLLIFFSIVIIVPVIEEIIFRGILWRGLEVMGLSPITLAIITSMVFTLFHTEPLHIVGVLPIGFFLGWLRQKSNSTIPTILCHSVNNCIAFMLIII